MGDAVEECSDGQKNGDDDGNEVVDENEAIDRAEQKIKELTAFTLELGQRMGEQWTLLKRMSTQMENMSSCMEKIQQRAIEHRRETERRLHNMERGQIFK